MGTKTFYVCDRCGKEEESISFSGDYARLELKWYYLKLDPPPGSESLPFSFTDAAKYYDICHDCVARLIQIIPLLITTNDACVQLPDTNKGELQQE